MIEDGKTDQVFQALASAARRQMLDLVRIHPGIAVGTLAESFDFTRIAVMKHLSVLESADLVISEKSGRTRKLYFNAIPIQIIYDRWSDEYSAYWSSKLTLIKYQAESKATNNTKETKNG
ncbi:helix-turn-helix transcriptional regulator [Parvularcula sp. IMCC14364]|uniref:ArsR/SmtB family transcription factor n=1 Tax=Parvularcula sp. IMCC14364 TaxID=3067902 RepID=UPI00274100DB|nr:helix-turn-helix transcriptional regulator [Parvularcula sp. IMCC14364]